MRKLTNKQINSASWLVDIFALTMLLICLFFIQISARALFTPDEGRYAEIAREMLVRHDYVTPYLNSIQYFEKPPLFYWLAAASMKLFGVKVFAARAINAVISILGALATYMAGRFLFDRRTGLLAALILSTSLLYFIMTHMISLDLPLTVFLAISLYSFLLASEHTPGRARLTCMWSSAGFAACAVLTKGLIGIIFPLLVIAPWLVLTGEWRKLRYYYLPTSFLVFIIIAAPWHILVSIRNPDFIHFYFIEQHFLRYTTMDVGHYQPVWYFIPCLIAGFFPWIVFLPQALSFEYRDKRQSFFILWAILIFLFFSFSKSKLIPYILPVFPALSILTARYLAHSWLLKRTRTLQLSFIALLIYTVVIAWMFYWFLHATTVPDPHTALINLSIASSVMIAGTCIALLTRQQTRKAIPALLAATYLFLLFLHAALPAIDTRSVLPLVNAVKPLLTENDDVITYNRYYQELPFYLQRRITILNWQNEMSHGMKRQDTSAWMINDKTFWSRWNSDQRVFVFMGQDNLHNWQEKYPSIHYFLVGETQNNAVITNHAVQ